MKRTILFLLAAALLLAACSKTPEPSECTTCNSVVIPQPPSSS